MKSNDSPHTSDIEIPHQVDVEVRFQSYESTHWNVWTLPAVPADTHAFVLRFESAALQPWRDYLLAVRRRNMYKNAYKRVPEAPEDFALAELGLTVLSDSPFE